ncbi:preprotein translocase subunit SecG [Hallella multisaccharivorax DSM 17128]|uniref:Protein-export membrane protein SecG n=1 Tax=Hallella multisaccharivorax DSM 17128 TaxID=688246 RepID=F8N808_9BACT|nr:preprotein translocase subunit SecG [Hallella multisaccharivorax]EGN57554.1 protein translocase subunit secG [Hallella multisaccharivorax DSM 17128]GJG31191.1 preprotein translocase subunit SecG [Hallella multisaccharivorax DSM 17128]
MYTLFIVLIVLVSLLMIFIVLIQESKGGGLASNFSSTNAIMGVRKTTDFIEKATWGLAAAMVVFSIVCAYTAPQAATSESVLERSATKTQSTNAANTQGFGAGQAPAQGQQGQQTPAQEAQKAPTVPAAPAK